MYILSSLSFFLDICEHSVVVSVHMHPCPEQNLLKVTVPLPLSQFSQLIQNFQTFRLLFGISEWFTESIEIPTLPVEIAVIFKQAWHILQNVDKKLWPTWTHQASNYVPCLDRGVVNNKLVLLLVFSLLTDLDDSLDKGKGVFDLF